MVPSSGVVSFNQYFETVLPPRRRESWGGFEVSSNSPSFGLSIAGEAARNSLVMIITINGLVGKVLQMVDLHSWEADQIYAPFINVYQ